MGHSRIYMKKLTDRGEVVDQVSSTNVQIIKEKQNLSTSPKADFFKGQVRGTSTPKGNVKRKIKLSTLHILNVPTTILTGNSKKH